MKSIATFVEVSKRLSFSDAARALGVPASTVTTRINALEAELGVRLLNRSTRKTAISTEGHDFLQHCVRALEEIEMAQEKLLAVQDTSGVVRISLPTAFPKADFAEYITEFRRLYRWISIDVLFDDALTDFIGDGVDLALRGRAPGTDGLFARRLADTPIIFVSPCSGKELGSVPLLTPLLPQTTDVLTTHGVFTRSLEFTLELVIAGQASAYLPLALCNAAIQSGKIVTSPGPLGPQEPLRLFLIYQEKRYQPRRVTLFKDFLIEKISA